MLQKSGKTAEARGLAARSQAKPSELDPEQDAKLAKREAELAKKRAQQMRADFFSLGNWSLTADVLKRFLDTPEVKQLMPGGAAQSRAEKNDEKTAAALLIAAKSFFGEIMSTKGRRSDSEMNAFWAAIAALMPAGLIDGRGGASAARILGVHHRVIKKGVEVRAGLEEHGKGWVQLQYSPHQDRVDLRLIGEWWHSDEGSTEDNQNKEPIRVYPSGDRRSRLGAARRAAARVSAPVSAPVTESGGGAGGAGSEAAGGAVAGGAAAGSEVAGGAVAGGDSARGEEETRSYCIHWRRAQNGSNKDALTAFRESPQARMLAEATKTAKRPGGVAVGIKLLVKARCRCIKPRRSAECDCKICSAVHHNLPIFNKSRQVWRQRAELAGECACGTCSQPAVKAAHGTQVLLPCPAD